MEPTAGASRAHRSPGRAGRVGRIQLGPRHVGIVVGLLIGAAVMLIVATLNDVVGTRVPVLSTLASAPIPDNERPLAERTPPPATPGTCLTWQRPDAADAVVVDCGRQHLFEQAGPVQLTDFKPGSPIPTNQRFRELVNDRCTPLVVTYLGNRYDPYGAFRAGALKPSQKSWGDGDRTLRCGLQRFSRSGALYPIVGKVTGQDQADIRPVGTCLGIDGRFIGDPIDCSLPHAEESVGAVDLGQKFSGNFPAPGDQDGYLQPQCSKLATAYAGGPDVINSKKLVVIWNNVTQQSWAAGTRRVACNLAAVLPDKSGYAPITGSVKGPVQIGDQPAPPAQQQVPPGAPAPGAGGRDDDSDGGEAADSPQTEPSIAPPVPLPLPSLGGGDKPGANPLGGAAKDGDRPGADKAPANPLGDAEKQGTNPLGGGDKPGGPLGGGKPGGPLGGGGNPTNPLGGEKAPELPKPAEATGGTPG
ncbi:MAG TPA: septum formation family protein [Pseudonocardia sp.]|nr:septum formation family protein [Pseudonocardia sp.]